jgi:hypothetical protein
VTAFADDAIELFGIGFHLTEDRKNPERWEFVAALGVSSVFNCVRSSWELFFVGYYVQALALLRTATEHMGLIWYIRDHPDEADDWLDFSKPQPMKAGTVLNEVFKKDLIASGHLYEIRQLLHQFAHQDNLALGLIYEDESPGFATRVGPCLDPRAFSNGSYFMVILSGLGLQAFGTWAGRLNNASAWNEAVEDYLQRIYAWNDRVAERYVHLVESMKREEAND